MSSDVIANFTCLDELTQVVYQGAYRFVVLSTVSDTWTLHLGLAGPEGRWWRGDWSKTDILQIVGSKSSDKLLEAFAEKLADTFVQGELHIGGFSTEEGAEIKLTFGPSSKKPVHVPLVELTSAEAASHATEVFLEIALQAQSRKCRLHPDQFATSDVPPEIAKSTSTSGAASRVPRPVVRVPDREPASNAEKNAEIFVSGSGDKKAQDEIRALKAELEKQRATPLESRAKPATAPKPLKGASLANPNKKARKYQAIEFESDDE